MRNPKPRALYLRFERDPEFRERLIKLGAPSYMVMGKTDQWLDDYGWDNHRVQRKIIEDEA